MTRRIINAYLETLLWSETLSATDEDGNPSTLKIPETSCMTSVAGDAVEDGSPLDSFLDVSDLPELAPKLFDEAREDLEGFAHYCEEELGFDPFEVFDAEKVAHEFCLSRNGHGAGFFDGSWVHEGTEYADELQDAARTFGTYGLQVWVNEGASDVSVESHS
jgi:hypothetical protein